MSFDYLILHDIELYLTVIKRKKLNLSYRILMYRYLNLNKEIDADNEEIIYFSRKDQKVTLEKEL